MENGLAAQLQSVLIIGSQLSYVSLELTIAVRQQLTEETLSTTNTNVHQYNTRTHILCYWWYTYTYKVMAIYSTQRCIIQQKGTCTSCTVACQPQRIPNSNVDANLGHTHTCILYCWWYTYKLKKKAGYIQYSKVYYSKRYMLVNYNKHTHTHNDVLYDL